MSTDPKAGDAIRGTNVRLVVSKGPERFRVDPALVGKAWADVQPQLQTDLPQIQFTTTEAFDDKLAKGAVVGFDPAAGTELKRDQVVTVVVSKGHAPVAVPDVTGQSPEQATSNLQALGFVVKKGDDGRSAAVAAGKVMAVSPGPGNGPVGFGSTVTITVSGGLPQVTVPDVTGMKQDDAVAALQALGLKADATRFLGNKVRQQEPKAGQVVDQGSTVKILVTP
jgi:serine/threonine-protein kinase